MKIVIKLPINRKGKFKLQSRGNITGKQYKTGAGILEVLSRIISGTGLKEKTSIIVKEYIHSYFKNINETLPSNDREYLLYCTACFLEDFISKATLSKAGKHWTKHLQIGGCHSVGEILEDYKFPWQRK